MTKTLWKNKTKPICNKYDKGQSSLKINKQIKPIDK